MEPEVARKLLNVIGMGWSRIWRWCAPGSRERGGLCGSMTMRQLAAVNSCKLGAAAERAQEREVPARTFDTRHSRLPESLGKFV